MHFLGTRFETESACLAVLKRITPITLCAKCTLDTYW